MPWSTPYTWPSGIGMRCPPLRSALLTTASNTRHPAQRRRRRARTKPARSTLVAVHPELDHARAERTLAQHRRRHNLPARRLRHEEGRDLAAGERAVGEVPERPLPRTGL